MMGERKEVPDESCLARNQARQDEADEDLTGGDQTIVSTAHDELETRV